MPGNRPNPEPMPTVNVSDLHSYFGRQIGCSGVVMNKQLRPTKKGSPFLHLTLADATGQVEANIWNLANEADKTFDTGHVLEVVADVGEYRNHTQLDVQRFKLLSEKELDFSHYPAGTTGRPDEFAAVPEGKYLEPGSWLATDRSAALALGTRRMTEQLVRKHSAHQAAAQQSESRAPVTPNEPPQQQRGMGALGSSRIEELKRKYGAGIRQPTRLSESARQIGEASTLPEPRMPWLQSGYILKCGVCWRTLAPVPLAQQPDKVCNCDSEHKLLPSALLDNRLGRKAEHVQWLVWDTTTDNALIGSSGAPELFNSVESAKNHIQKCKKTP